MKKLLSFLLVALCAMAVSAYDFTEGGLYYNTIGSSWVSVTYKSNNTSDCSGAIVIPSTVQHEGVTYEVIHIDEYAFASSSVTSVFVPSSVMSVGKRAFENCLSLLSLSLPSTVSFVPEYLCYNDRLLTSVTLSGANIIDEYAFSQCTELQNVVFSEDLDTIRQYAFNDCKSLAHVSFPAKLRGIGKEAFLMCLALDSVVLGDSLTVLGQGAFRSCSALTYAHIGSGLTTLPKNAFYECTSLRRVSLSEGLTTIGSSAFSYCTPLDSVVLPESVVRVGAMAFYKNSITAPICNSHFFVYLPENYTSYNLAEGTTEIAADAFEGCKLLTKLTLPSTLTKIGSSAFDYCLALDSLVIPDGVTTLPAFCFSNCTALTYLSIGSGLTTVDYTAFSGTSGIRTLIVHAATPASCNATEFDDIPATQACLFVPAGTVEDYREASGWSHFSLIAEIGADRPTSLDAAAAADCSRKILRDGQVLIVKEGKTYDLSGRCVE